MKKDGNQYSYSGGTAYCPRFSSDKSVTMDRWMLGMRNELKLPFRRSVQPSQVARILYEHNLIQNEKFFVGYCRVKDWDQNLKAGFTALIGLNL